MPSADSSCAVGGIPTPPSQFPWPATSQDSHEVSRGKSYSLRCIDAGFIKHVPLWREDLGVACPLVPNVPHLISGSCSSPRTCAPRFLQTPPHGDALALRLSFGSTFTWTGDSHPLAVRHARHTRERSLATARPYLLMFLPNRNVAVVECNAFVRLSPTVEL
jgi:hypothetical protein